MGMTYRINRGKGAQKFGIATARDTRNGIQSAEGRTLLKRIRNKKIWVLAVYYIPLHVSSTMCSSSGAQIVLYSIWYRHLL